MEQLQQAIEAKEKEFIAKVEELLKTDCSNRIKLGKIYYAYVSCQAKINTLLENAWAFNLSRLR